MIGNVLNLMKEKDTMKNKNKLRLASDNTTEGGNWLANMPINTFFVAEEKHTDNPVVQEFLKLPTSAEFRVVVDLMVNPRTSGKDFTFIKVNPARFIRKYELVEVLDLEIEGPSNVPSDSAKPAGVEESSDGKETVEGSSSDGEPSPAKDQQ